MNKDIKKILVSEEEIENICKRLGAQISKDYENKEIVVIGMLKGCLPFMMKLIKYITVPMTMDFMQVSSYVGKESCTLIFKKDIDTDLKGKHVIVVDDIIDTGKTIHEIFKLFKDRNALSLEMAVLLDKPEGRLIDYNPKYVGTLVPKEFVVGFGLDYNEYYRNLPYIGVLKEEVYSNK